MGKKKNASKAIDSGEEDILWNYRKLGDSSSTSTFWSARLSGTHIYEDQKFCCVLRDINGCEYIEFLEDPTKTRQGGLRPNQRATNRKMFAVRGERCPPVGGERCPARLLKMHLSKRPDDLKNSGRFYLTPKQNVLQTDEIWYTKNSLGKNTVSSIMKALISSNSIRKLWEKTNKSQYEKNSG